MEAVGDDDGEGNEVTGRCEEEDEVEEDGDVAVGGTRPADATDDEDEERKDSDVEADVAELVEPMRSE